ncbi:hypothetical protein C5167_008643 [Papaver somniferum]|uniref:Uncharacterized protein n=1 Tax=Papaver somniferum TaxID=3469 RepID=A0A4Y7JZ29_PAPSO|nr:hypothetical protein C5167_008643 [Papaver somniferum]
MVKPAEQVAVGGGGGSQVRCAGCKMILSVASGMVEFICPSCQLPQRLPPQLLLMRNSSNNNHLQQLPPIQTHGVDPTKIQLPCAHCKAILNVPHGLSRFSCPQCGIDLAVDLTKIKHLNQLPLPHQLEDVNEVAVDVEREEDEGGLAGETFTDYRPPKVSIGPPHPDHVVETSSLSAVQPPEPTYDLETRENLESSKSLSCLQIETLVYASQRHLQHLEGGARAGFFIGDGAGVGKGRTIAGLIWENWHHGRKKSLWISVGSDLKFDARRDLDDVGATCIQVHALNKLPYSKLDSKSVGIKEGVVFLTYSSLIASSEKGRSRLQQLLQWCGSEYDSLVVFDECHKAKNLIPEAGSQPTRTGEAVLELQVDAILLEPGLCILQFLLLFKRIFLADKLPGARVVYCSATGASEPRNMGYMVRLGLWGVGTCFPNFRDFLGALDKGGVGALELVAMDMKARGMYVCRTLSYKGSEFEVVEAPLDVEMMNLYKKAAEFWAELRVELLSASAVLCDEKPNSSQLWRLYWASHQDTLDIIMCSQIIEVTVEVLTDVYLWNFEVLLFINGCLCFCCVQRFFRHICMSAKVPAAVRLAKQALLENKCVVIGLQSTGEARTEEAVTKYQRTDEYLLARDVYLAEMRKRYEAASDRKSKILDIIRSLSLPNNPLDDIIDQILAD